MRSPAAKARAAAVLPAAFAMLFVGGCADGIELRGRAFEMVGLAGNDSRTAPEDVPTRAPLVLPPGRNLPEPGPRHAAADPADWPDDPDRRAELAEEERQRKLEEYYRSGDWSGEGGIEEFEKLGDEGARRPGLFGDGPVSDRHR